MMTENEIFKSGRLHDPASGRDYTHGCRLLCVERGLSDHAADLHKGLNIGPHILLVSDPATHQVLGANIERQFNILETFLLSTHPQPTEAIAKQIADRAANCDMIVGVGSGSINDLCKYAGKLSGKPYVIWATALSMNGYLSANASIWQDGIKKTLPAAMPVAAFFDLDVLAAAPARLTRSGFGDALCRPTAQADWLLSHLVRGTAYDPFPFTLLAPYETALLNNAKGLIEGDREMLHALAASLILSGLGMTWAGGSYPASQGEHMIAHTMEMKHGHRMPPSYHGEQIGVTTLTMAALQEKILDSSTPSLADREEKIVYEKIETYFGPERAEELWRDYLSKSLSRTESEKLREDWPKIMESIASVTRPRAQLEKALHDIGAPTMASALGWENADYADALTHAKYSRGRFTFLDLEG